MAPPPRHYLRSPAVSSPHLKQGTRSLLDDTNNNIFDGFDQAQDRDVDYNPNTLLLLHGRGENDQSSSQEAVVVDHNQDQSFELRPEPTTSTTDNILQDAADDSASWDTRARILFAEVAVVTLIFGTVFFFCFRRRQRKAKEDRRRLFDLSQLREWTTIRMPGGAVVVAMPPSADGRPGRIRVESGLSGMDVGRNSGMASAAGGSGRGGSSSRMRMDSNVSGMGVTGRSDGMDVSRNSGIVSRDGRLRMDSNISGMGTTVSVGRDGRIRVDSSIAGMSVAPAPLAPQPVQAAVSNTNEDNNTTNEGTNGGNNRNRASNALLAIPRTIGHVLLAPLRMLEAGVNDWATENQDEVFLRQFMERLEVEREATRENPDDREARLKEAFVKECMIWELDEENFIPPKDLWGDDGDDEYEQDDLKQPAKNDPGQDCEQRDFGLYHLDEANVPVLQGLEEECGDDAKSDSNEYLSSGEPQKAELSERQAEDNRSPDDCQNSENSDITREETDQAIKAADSADVSEQELECALEQINDVGLTLSGSNLSDDNSVGNTATPIHFSGDESPTCEPLTATAMVDEVVENDSIANAVSADVVEQSPSAEDLGEKIRNEDLTVAAASAAAPTAPVHIEDTFDDDDSPGYLYLNTFANGRRRANTSESNGTSEASSSANSKLPNVESMDTMSSAAASSTSSDQYKIPNECAICLCGYEKGDTIVTSCNPECPHVFHLECIVEWLVKMQEGTPCPCCRRTFVELDGHNNSHNASSSNNGNINTGSNTANVNSTNNAANHSVQYMAEAERRINAQREETRRRNIELGLRRGGRAFNTSVISMRLNGNHGNSSAARAPEQVERLREERLERSRRNIELGLRRGGRAFNTSVISMR